MRGTKKCDVAGRVAPPQSVRRWGGAQSASVEAGALSLTMCGTSSDWTSIHASASSFHLQATFGAADLRGKFDGL